MTPQTTTAFNARNVNLQLSSLARLQRQASSGIGVERPSDDPVKLRESLLLKDAQSRLASHLESVNKSRTHLQQAHVALLDAQDVFVQAQQIAIDGRQAETSDLKTLAQEVDSLLDRLQRLANSDDVAGALFGGTALDRQPFPQNSVPGATPDYAGSDAATRLVLGDQADLDSLRPGNFVFDTAQRQATIIEGQTGAAPGTGTDTATGSRNLIVEHLVTSYAGGSGIQPGTSSAAGDTIIGTNTLQIDDTSGTGAFGTISLNGGSEFAFTSSDTDLLVVGPNQQQVYVDTTAITPGFSGAVTVQGDGQVSVDEGATFVPVTFAANQTLIDSRDGSTVNVDTSGISQSGSDRIEFPETADAFEVLKMLRDDLLEAAALPSSIRSARIGRRIEDIQRIQDHVLEEVGKQSVQLENLDKLQTLFEDKQLQVETDLTNTTSADISQIVLEMQQAQSLLQYTYATVSQLYNNSFISFLR